MRGPERRRTLVVRVECDPLPGCRYCGGSGWLPVPDLERCPCCEERYSAPTTADLLADPRVVAAVRGGGMMGEYLGAVWADVRCLRRELRDALRQLALCVTCPTCGARPDDPCTTAPLGRPGARSRIISTRVPHASRHMLARDAARLEREP